MALLHVGFYNYVPIDHIVGVLDARNEAIRRIISDAKTERPQHVLDVTKGRRRLSVVVLTGDRYILSPLSTKKLANRLGITDTDED